MPKISQKLKLTILFLAITLFLFSAFVWLKSAQNKNLEVIFFDVGQGDSILIRTPDKNNILIDGGEDSTVLYKLGKYLPFYDKTIDLMILTHPHSDHVGGLVGVLKRYNVQNVLSAGVVHTSPDYLEWLEIIKEKKINFIKAGGYKKIKFSSDANGQSEIALEILYPQKDISQDSFDDLNSSSVVSKLTFGKNSFLFMGDLPIQGEKELIKIGADLRADVLKVGHHGSKYSSSLEFLEAVNPRYAVIQVGKNNKFGHPSMRTILNLEKKNIKVLRDDELGDIIINSDGKDLILR
ncbi:MAG: ComEC/Rec2 family competence protein [bacterium]